MSLKRESSGLSCGRRTPVVAFLESCRAWATSAMIWDAIWPHSKGDIVGEYNPMALVTTVLTGRRVSVNSSTKKAVCFRSIACGDPFIVSTVSSPGPKLRMILTKSLATHVFRARFAIMRAARRYVKMRPTLKQHGFGADGMQRQKH